MSGERLFIVVVVAVVLFRARKMFLACAHTHITSEQRPPMRRPILSQPSATSAFTLGLETEASH